MRMKKWEKVAAEKRAETKADLKKKLEENGRCALVRCTGFGKTTMMAEMTKEYDSVLYLYPAEIIMNTALDVVSRLGVDINAVSDEFDAANIKFMTYMKLIRLDNDEILELAEKYDLIIMDECHKCGAEKTGQAVRMIMDNATGHVIGATATPDRSDAFDVINEFFGGICVKEYTLKDAFDDGIIKRPIYTFMSYDEESDLKEEAFTAGEDINDIRVREVYKQKFFEMHSIFNIPNVIKNVTEKYLKDRGYMKFIVFFATHRQLHEQLEDVKRWFSEACPEHEIETLIITSENREYANNVDKLASLTKKEKHIDLICVVDMLNLGYHVKDLTGIFMCRCTGSSTIYSQQIGRALSTGTDARCLVFDIVDNLHRRSVFDAERKERERREGGKKDPAVGIVKNLDIEGLDKEGLIAAFMQIAYSGSAHAESAVSFLRRAENADGSEDTEKLMKAMRDFLLWILREDEWWKNASEFNEEDVELATINGVPYEASYREMLAKLIALPMFMRERRAGEAHKRRFEKRNGRPYFKSREEAEANMDTMKPSIEPYAKWQNVQIRNILDAMFGDEPEKKRGK